MSNPDDLKGIGSQRNRPRHLLRPQRTRSWLARARFAADTNSDCPALLPGGLHTRSPWG